MLTTEEIVALYEQRRRAQGPLQEQMRRVRDLANGDVIVPLNELDKNKLAYDIEIVIEPSNRLWELRKIKNKFKKKGETTKSIEKNENKLVIDNTFNWTCRLEDRFHEKLKRGGLFFNYWSGFLIKIRKI